MGCLDADQAHHTTATDGMFFFWVPCAGGCAHVCALLCVGVVRHIWAV